MKPKLSVFVFYCYRTYCHKLSNLKQHMFIISQFPCVRSPDTAYRDSLFRVSQVALKILAKAMVSYEATYYFIFSSKLTWLLLEFSFFVVVKRRTSDPWVCLKLPAMQPSQQEVHSLATYLFKASS